MTLEVLVSCMHQTNFDIVKNSCINTDVLIVNQCNVDDYLERNNNSGFVERMICTRERGLSRSRNAAIEHARGDICLICDDDEVLEHDYAETILKAFQDFPQADVITFKVNHPMKSNYPNNVTNVGYIDALATSSCQIAFKRRSIIENNISFDVQMGSGTGNGGGEENKFLFDCLRHRLKIYFVPRLIATVPQTESQWFFGYTPKFMRDKGWAVRRIMGTFVGYLYVWTFIVRKYSLYKKECSFFRAIKEIHVGFFESR